MPTTFPHGSHITRKRGVYHYRRRLPGSTEREVCLSLHTRSFREAEYRATILDGAFKRALTRARGYVTDATDLNTVLRDYLREFLKEDLERRMDRRQGTPVYGYWWSPGDPGTAAEADLQAIRMSRDSLAYDLASNDPKEMEDEARRLIHKHHLPDTLLRPLAYGLLEAAIQGWNVVERRTLGIEPLVFDTSGSPASPPTQQSSVDEPQPAKSSAPLASSLAAAFGEWGRASGGWRANGESQAITSVGMFLEVCGDRPIDTYTRADGDLFRTTLRKLPTHYRKSPADRAKPLSQIIAEADACNARRIGDKTVKRHFWALSRFFGFLIETGRLPQDTENPGQGFTFNVRGAARKQRDMWTGAELTKLFTSPIWSGCHPHFRSRPGTEIIRDSRFWLPLLGLFHGNRLEEFAQLRRSDVGQDDGVWYLHITDEDGRQLKNEQSRRMVPLHSELILIGFLEHVAGATTNPNGQVFPELRPGGKDRKLGYYFSKQFSAYRLAIGVRRPGLDYHSFRHGVTTKLYEAEVNEAWIDLLTGHDEAVSESRRRYLKGIPLSQLRGAIERVRWPELDLSHLYVREAGDEHWPTLRAQTAAEQSAEDLIGTPRPRQQPIRAS